MKWYHGSTERHVETVDGRPLICHTDFPRSSQRTYTVGADGKVQVRVIDRTTTQPAVEETTTWPEVILVGKPPDIFKDRKPWKIILHVDDDLIWRKIRLDGDPIKMTLIACSRAEAMRLPAPE